MASWQSRSAVGALDTKGPPSLQVSQKRLSHCVHGDLVATTCCDHLLTTVLCTKPQVNVLIRAACGSLVRRTTRKCPAPSPSEQCCLGRISQAAIPHKLAETTPEPSTLGLSPHDKGRPDTCRCSQLSTTSTSVFAPWFGTCNKGAAT